MNDSIVNIEQPTLAACPQECGHQQHLGQVHCTVNKQHRLNSTQRDWDTNHTCLSVCVCVFTPEALLFTLCPSGRDIWGFVCSQ